MIISFDMRMHRIKPFGKNGLKIAISSSKQIDTTDTLSSVADFDWEFIKMYHETRRFLAHSFVYWLTKQNDSNFAKVKHEWMETNVEEKKTGIKQM